MLLLLGASTLSVHAQEAVESPENERRFGTLTGGFQLDAQYYFEDSTIGAQDVPEELLYNTYLNLNYRIGKFQAGARFEAYQNPLLGFSPKFAGEGIPFRYAGYGDENFNVTVGTFYEQFGSGMALRAYWEPLLGTDNALDGVLVRGRIAKAVHLKGLFGRQRLYFGRGNGIVRGADLEVDLHTLLDSAATWNLSLGGSAVSRYLADDDPSLVLPQNVAVLAGRFNLGAGRFNLYGEYAWKAGDPALYNRYLSQYTIYNPGSGILVTASYSQKGLGITLSAKRLENMDFRSSRDADFAFNELPINFLPPLAQQHTWRLQTLYLYATAPNGEIGVQGDIVYKLPKESLLGGKYGMDISLNVSEIHNLNVDTTGLVANLEYAGSEFLEFGDRLLYRDINLEITKKLSPKLRLQVAYLYTTLDLALTRIGEGTATVHTAVVDVVFKPKARHALHLQAQHLYTPQDQGPTGNEGSWAMLLAEYSLAPHWFVALWDEYNYGNPDSKRRQHYIGSQLGYTFGANRIAVGYARQRAGIICVGGVCRALPASNGITLSISSTF